MKKITALALALLMVLSCGITGSATELEIEDNRLISTENIEINGISTTVKTYDDQGFIVTTYEFTDEGLTKTDMEDAISVIESELSSDSPSLLASGPTATASKKFNTSEHSPTDVSLTASQSGTFCKSIDNEYAYLWIVGGVSKAAYTSPDYTPSSISISPNSITNSASATYKYVIPLRAGNGTQTEHTQDPTYGLTVYNTVNWTTSYEDVFVYAHFDNAQVSFDLSDSKIRLGGIDFHCLTYGIPKPSTGRVYVRQQKDYSVPTSSLSFRGYTYDPGFTYAVGTTQAECQFGCNIEITLLRGNASEWSFVAPNTVFQT